MRAWQANTGPPAAKTAVILVSGDRITRAQSFGVYNRDTPLKVWLTDPLVVAGIAAVAIAVPGAIHNYRQDRDTGS